MKTIITFILACIVVSCLGQNNNKLVLDFIKDHKGKKVGDGICMDLLYYSSLYCDSINGYRDSIVEDVSIKEIQAGDFIEFQDVVTVDGYSADKHLAVIYSVLKDGKLKIAEQNVGKADTTIMYQGDIVPLVKDSRVKITTIDISRYSGTLVFSRL